MYENKTRSQSQGEGLRAPKDKITPVHLYAEITNTTPWLQTDQKLSSFEPIPQIEPNFYSVTVRIHKHNMRTPGPLVKVCETTIGKNTAKGTKATTFPATTLQTFSSINKSILISLISD